MLAACSPGDRDTPRTWPAWARLLPHLRAIDPAASDSPGLRALACEAAWYLIRRGDAPGSHDLASGLRHNWCHRLGPDDPDTLRATQPLARALSAMDHYRQARELNEDTLARCRRTLGDNHLVRHHRGDHGHANHGRGG